jgi:hypothetical protein
VDLTTAILTGLGLAVAAGLNAYIPLLVVGLLQWFGWVAFPAPYDALGEPWVVAVLAVLLAVEVLADKIPAVDSANDLIQTFVRPLAGAVLFAGSVGMVDQLHPAIPLLAGLLTAGAVHGTKAAVRPALNVGTAGTAAPVVSTIEDVISLGLSVLAFVAPLLVLVVLAVGVWLVVRLVRRRRTASPAP